MYILDIFKLLLLDVKVDFSVVALSLNKFVTNLSHGILHTRLSSKFGGPANVKLVQFLHNRYKSD